MAEKFCSESYIDCLWAKKSDKDGIFKWLPLKQHLIDTMEVSNLLFEHWFSLSQKRLIIDSLGSKTEGDAKRIVGFLGAIHDLGKATPTFQTRPSFIQSPDLDRILLSKLEMCGFNNISNFYNRLANPANTPHALATQALLASYGVSSEISTIAGAHHGTPVDGEGKVKSQLNAYEKNYYQETKAGDKVNIKWKRIQREIFEWALMSNGYNGVGDLPKITLPAQVILSGLVIMADWIASNEKYFPLIPIDEVEVDDKTARLKKGWLGWYKTSAKIEPDIIDINKSYKERFNFKPRDIQYKFAEVIQNISKPGIVIFEAPMGVGKTEAALMAIEQFSYKSGSSGMYFGLPTQATSNGIFPRIINWMEKLQSDGARSLQLVHGKAFLNKSYTSIVRPDNIYDESDGSIIVNQWFTGRKTAILDDFVVGTIDQLLMMGLKQKHLMLRHLALSKKVVVIDEVHAYDAYMSEYLYSVLRWLSAYDVPVVLLSATLPLYIRNNLIENYIRGSKYKWRDVEKPNNFNSNLSYPLISYSDKKSINQYSDFNNMDSKQVEIIKLNEEDLISTLIRELNMGGIAGVIVNTVKRSQEISKKLVDEFGENTIDLLHSNFISTQRVIKEKNMLEEIGRGGSRPFKKIIVGTQVIEQSLDIDFDVLITDLSPMDLLIQRIGRLHRHELPFRPIGLQLAKTYVIGTNTKFEYDSGNEAVYGKYLLMRTQEFLPRMIDIPADIPRLVQDVYSGNNLKLSEKYEKIYIEAKKEQEIKIINKKNSAQTYLIDRPSHRDNIDLIGWLSTKANWDSDEKKLARVRDIEETIEVVALKKRGDGYGFFEEDQAIRWEADDMDLQKKIASNTLRLPLQLSRTYNIDRNIDFLERYTLKNFPCWQNSVWLKGALGIIFDEYGKFEIGDLILNYDQKYGLSLERGTSD